MFEDLAEGYQIPFNLLPSHLKFFFNFLDYSKAVSSFSYISFSLKSLLYFNIAEKAQLN